MFVTLRDLFQQETLSRLYKFVRDVFFLVQVQ